MELEILHTTRGKPCIIVDGFQYFHCYHNRNNVVSWRCSKRRSSNCHTMIKTSNGVIVSMSNKHTCEREETKMEVKRALLRAKKRVLETCVPFKEIYKQELDPLIKKGKEFAAEVPKAAQFVRGAARVVRRNIRRRSGLILSTGEE